LSHAVIRPARRRRRQDRGRPATFTVPCPLLEGRRVYDSASRSWIRPVNQSWDELWQRLPRFRRIWRICTVI